ncbi:type 1 fimbrial protein, partial [Klebsiella pneumoniae]|nr:type 1 fimbrial protein [Klebsiella pneumoniae]
IAVLFDGARHQSYNPLLAINGRASGVTIKLYEHDQSTAVSLSKTSNKKTDRAGTSESTGTDDVEFDDDYISSGTTET